MHISINQLVCKNPKYYCNQCAQKFFQGGVKKYVGAYNHKIPQHNQATKATENKGHDIRLYVIDSFFKCVKRVQV